MHAAGRASARRLKHSPLGEGLEGQHMCRLYGFLSNAQRKVECELIRAQNSLIAQSVRDQRGESNPHGWGLGTYSNGDPYVIRQTDPAYESETFRWTAAHVHTCNVMAHVRRATVGKLSLENTHPFVHSRWLFVHNGDVGTFQVIRPKILETIPQSHRNAIRGETDSEHIFRLIISLHEQQPKKPILEILRRALQKVIDWSKEADPSSEVALNILLSNGEEIVGSRYGRSLWYVERDKIHPCEVCTGELHCHEDPGKCLSCCSSSI